MLHDPELVPEAVLFPFMCMCGNGNGPFIDLMVEDAGEHRYLCMERCGEACARALNWSPPEHVDDLVGRLAAAVSENERVCALLEAERENKVLSLADAKVLLETAKTSTPKPRAKVA